MSGVYDEILRIILENGKRTSVRVDDRSLPAVEYCGYYVINVGGVPKIFDGEHIIEPDFRVFDVHLKQYIYYGYPVERLLSTFGYDTKNVLEGVSAGGSGEQFMWIKLITWIIEIGASLVWLYMLFTGDKRVYYLVAICGICLIIDSLVEKKFIRRVSKSKIAWGIILLVTGLYGIFVLL